LLEDLCKIGYLPKAIWWPGASFLLRLIVVFHIAVASRRRNTCFFIVRVLVLCGVQLWRGLSLLPLRHVMCRLICFNLFMLLGVRVGAVVLCSLFNCVVCDLYRTKGIIEFSRIRKATFITC